MIQTIRGIVLARIVSDPLAVGMDVGSLRMSLLVGIGGMLGGSRGVRRSFCRRGSVFGNIPAAHFRFAASMLFVLVLGENSADPALSIMRTTRSESSYNLRFILQYRLYFRRP